MDVVIDEGGDSAQSYVEDCPVCCRPWQVEVTQDDSGEWSVVLRTAEE